jgi:predicted ATPase
VVGLGGVGKTRLALEAATTLAQIYADSMCFVPLVDVDSTADVATAILRRLGLPLVGAVDPVAQLTQALRRRHLLLVLDNVEQLLREPEMCEMLVWLLAEAPRVTLLVTSRERLNLQAEWALPLEGLPLDEPAITLFADRARRVGRHVLPDEAAVAAICRLVEGLPLAVELAAGWTQFMTPAQIAAQLQAELPPLPTRLRDVPERHRSLEALFDQSWALLTTFEQAIFMRLAVFRGGFDSGAAAAMAGADLPSLLGLVDKSLVRADGSGGYDLHALARRYAERRLELTGATAAVRERHADYYIALVRRAADQERVPVGEQRWGRVEAAYANIQAAWQWAMEARRWAALWQVAPALFTVERWDAQQRSAHTRAPLQSRARRWSAGQQPAADGEYTPAVWRPPARARQAGTGTGVLHRKPGARTRDGRRLVYHVPSWQFGAASLARWRN